MVSGYFLSKYVGHQITSHKQLTCLADFIEQWQRQSNKSAALILKRNCVYDARIRVIEMQGGKCSSSKNTASLRRIYIIDRPLRLFQQVASSAVFDEE